MNNRDTTADRLIRRLKDNPWIAVAIATGAVVIAFSSFTSAAKSLWDLLKTSLPSNQFVVGGSVIPEYGASAPTQVHVTVIWEVDGVDRDAAFQDARVSKIDPATGRLDYKITFEAPPPEEVLMNWQGVRLGIGCILAFNDTSKNGILDREEQIVASSSKRAITYLRGDLRSATAPAPGQERDIWTLLRIKQGYSLARVIPPEEHEYPVPFDDLVPIPLEPVTLVIPRDSAEIACPNWT